MHSIEMAQNARMFAVDVEEHDPFTTPPYRLWDQRKTEIYDDLMAVRSAQKHEELDTEQTEDLLSQLELQTMAEGMDHESFAELLRSIATHFDGEE